jgi:hypothetical protein
MACPSGVVSALVVKMLMINLSLKFCKVAAENSSEQGTQIENGDRDAEVFSRF